MKLLKAIEELLELLNELDTVNSEELVNMIHAQADVVSLLAGE